MKGYKVFEPNWTCKGFQYAVGEVFEIEEEPICCNRGFHFCKELKDCFNYYTFNLENKVAEIEALGDIDIQDKDKDSKCCTNKIKIVREISWEEALKKNNSGKGNVGLCNSGDHNRGRCNSGYCNNGGYNSGNYNMGYYNSGECNNGYYNSGYRNTGYYNSGECNSGDWNKTSFSSGCFNTEEATILMFNKPSDWTLRDWRNSKARSVLSTIPKNNFKWISPNKMTDEEKEQYPEYMTTVGYLKEVNNSECNQVWWNNLANEEKDVIKALPNFDADIFKEITGIDVNENLNFEKFYDIIYIQ
jgi:hypothetical protein